MCGRYGRRGDKQRIAEWMQTHDTNVFDESDETNFAPSFNVAPQSFQPVVRLNSETGQRELTVMRWGLVPYWSKDGKASFSTINAKSETVATSPAFREASRPSGTLSIGASVSARYSFTDCMPNLCRDAISTNSCSSSIGISALHRQH